MLELVERLREVEKPAFRGKAEDSQGSGHCEPSMPRGEHTFTIAREGFRTDSGAFTVTAGNEVRMRRTLTKASP